MTEKSTFILALVGAAFLAPVVMRLAAWATASASDRMFCAAERLLKNPALQEQDEEFVLAMAKDAHDWTFMVRAAIFLPIIALADLFNLIKMPAFPKDPAIQRDMEKFLKSHLKLVAAANPLFAVVVTGEFILLVLFLLPAARGLGKAVAGACKVLFETNAELERHGSFFRDRLAV